MTTREREGGRRTFEEGCASRSGSSYDEGHLTRLEDTVEVVEEELFVLSELLSRGLGGGRRLLGRRLLLVRSSRLLASGVLGLLERVEHAEKKNKGRKMDASALDSLDAILRMAKED